MKKTLSFIVIILCLLIIGAWWSKTPSSSLVQKHPDVKSPEAILNNDFEKITRNLNPKNIDNAEWGQINNYALKAEDIVSKDNAKGFFVVSKNNLPDLYSCLKKDFCGMETRGEDDAYFDDQRTPAHILINRHLKVMKESLRKDPALASEVDWKLLEEMASANSEMLSSEALNIMREFNSEAMKTEDLLTLTEDAKGETKANSLLQISKKANAVDKALIASKIGNIFESDDPNTVISVLEKVKKMALNSVQLPDVLRNLCRFKSENDHNWPMIKYEAKQVYSQFESICN